MPRRPFAITITPPRCTHHCAPFSLSCRLCFRHVQTHGFSLTPTYPLSVTPHLHNLSGFPGRRVPGTHRVPVVALFALSYGTITVYTNHTFFLYTYACDTHNTYNRLGIDTTYIDTIQSKLIIRQPPQSGGGGDRSVTKNPWDSQITRIPRSTYRAYMRKIRAWSSASVENLCLSSPRIPPKKAE